MRFSIFSVILLLLVFASACEPKPDSSASADTAVVVPELDAATPDSTSMPVDETAVTDPSCCNCNVTVYLNDPDNSGTNVREEPGSKKILRQLQYDPDCDCAIVDVVDSKNGWLKLKEGGWVFAELFAVDTRNYREGQEVYLNEYTTDESKVLATYKGEQQFKVLGCEKTWLYVKGKDGKKGWLTAEMQCANPLTTCP